MRHFLLVGLLATAASTGGRAQPTAPLDSAEADSLAALESLAGTWTGPLTRHYNPGVWEVTFKADPATGRYTARYVRHDAPALVCEGALSVREMWGAGSVLFDQRLATNNCLTFDDGGLIHQFGIVKVTDLRSDPGVRHIEVLFPPGSPWEWHPEAMGVLERREP